MRGVRSGVAGLVSLAAALAAALPAAAAARPPAQGFLESMNPTATNVSWGAPGSPLTAYSMRAPDGSGRLNLVAIPYSQAWVNGPRPSSSLFDPDVEALSWGHPSVVYTRCGGVSGRNCDIYRFSRLGERKVHGASSTRCSEFAPSIWMRRVVFGRSGPRGCPGLYIARRDGSVKRLDRRVPADTDVWNDRAVYLYIPAANSSTTQIREVPTAGGPSRLLVAGFAGVGEKTRVSNPNIVGPWVYWLHTDLRRDEFLVGRIPARGRARTLQFSDFTLPGKVDSIAVESSYEPDVLPAVWYTNGTGLYRATGISFSAPD